MQTSTLKWIYISNCDLDRVWIYKIFIRILKQWTYVFLEVNTTGYLKFFSHFDAKGRWRRSFKSQINQKVNFDKIGTYKVLELVRQYSSIVCIYLILKVKITKFSCNATRKKEKNSLQLFQYKLLYQKIHQTKIDIISIYLLSRFSSYITILET